MPGRNRKDVWDNFRRTKKEGNTGVWAICKCCNIGMQGIPARLEKHLEKCVSDRDIEVPVPKQPKKDDSLSSVVSVTNKQEKDKIDVALAEFFYATNTPFQRVEHPAFKKLLKMLRPSYQPPDRKVLASELLEKVHDNCVQKASGILKDEHVTLSLDGWSNVHNQPIVCVAATTSQGETYLVDSVDTKDNSHTAEYLQTLAESAVENSESTFKFKVVGFVTDNTGNVTKLRRNLQNSPVCSVLYLPSEVRWNTVFKCLDSYIEAWPHMMSVVEEHREEVSSNIYQFVTNIGLKRSAEDYRKVLHPIAVALDKMQGSRATISDAVMIWHTLSEELNGTLPNEKQLQLSKRREMCLTDFHKLAFLLDPRYLNTNVLDAAEQESALQKAFELHPDLVAVIAQFRAKASPFIKSYYEVAQQINPHDWWSLAADIPQSVKDIIIGLLSCSPSTASLERLFSSYGWIHSEIRNRPKSEKAAKLLFIFKVLNNA